MRGATMHPFRTLAESLVNLTALAGTLTAPAYLVWYYGNVDTLSHEYGPDAEQTEAQIETLLHALDRWFLRKARGALKNTLFVLTADHGQIAVTPRETRYLNTEPGLREIVSLLKTDARGQVLVPGGSARDVFLYVRDEALVEALDLLAKRLAGYADVVETRALVDNGYFGPLPVSDELCGRLGNVTILPFPHKCVWWYEPDRFEQKFFGHHGGLSPAEMEIPLALLELD
jgi:predicted AlkP superfamily pyrophosphatase or phosphodiesterase